MSMKEEMNIIHQTHDSYKEFKPLKETNINTNFVKDVEERLLQGKISENEANLILQERAKEIYSICKTFLDQFIS